MLPYKNRLLYKKDFEVVYRYGDFFSFGNVLLKVNKNQTDQTRVGFSIGIKFSKKAVERNRVKRQLRDIIYKSLRKMQKGFDVVVMIKKGERKPLNSQSLEKDLLGALEKGNLIIN